MHQVSSRRCKHPTQHQVGSVGAGHRDYNVYARWAADAANATIASYTVYYAGGTTIVPMNQTQQGRQWNLLGTFTFNPQPRVKPDGGIVRSSQWASGSRCGDGGAQWREHRSCHLLRRR
ncbi:MAG: hypothetical protein R3B95_06195 [Nitrospirales bacterium]|nr:hypothetical protein [Nitrospirales bacterium]